MKRLWIALGIVLLIIGVSIGGLFHLMQVSDRLTVSLDTIQKALPREDLEELERLAQQFGDQWRRDEQLLLHYIHHEALDTIDGAVARLPALARYGAIPEFAAEVDLLRELIEHVRDAEMPNLRNIF